MDPLELRVHRLNSEAFINADPVSLVLHRGTVERTASGGYRRNNPQPLADAQTFRLIPASGNVGSGKVEEIKTSTGRLSAPTYVILGKWDCNLEQWDTFLLNGTWYEVASHVRPEHTTTSVYERKADVVVREDA